ncbi:MAG: PVC-type heme-binding CxxCH protein [Pirellulales bacterium]
MPSRKVCPLLACLACLVSVTSASADDAPLPLDVAAQSMTLPEGFQATLFAGEPDVVQPIAMAFDDRGRLWVVECLSYPDWSRDGQGRDRVLIFDDRDGDGRFDERTVFFDQGSNLSGIELGYGGVWLCSTPNLLFIPDRDGDDRPDGPPEVILDGWDLEAKHNVFNGLCWGPDGWLYGLNGILSNSLVGKPGTPSEQRQAINCGVWRYHPTGQTFEVVAHGTTNAWGIDFDEAGELFITNCVIGHLWHVVPGARFQRMFGQDFNPYSYQLMESCADHIHWAGGAWYSSRGGQGEHSKTGGGHAHSGAMVYLGDNWPDEHRGNLFTVNIHGNRVNRDLFERAGSGYVARHGPDFLFANDTWFRGLALRYGPDGGVYLCDWTDSGECHDYEDIHRDNGRIYKIAYGQTRAVQVDLARLGDLELVELMLHKNDWFVSHARRILAERAAAGPIDPQARAGLLRMLDEHPDVSRRLRALWALHVTGSLQPALLNRQLDSEAEHLRAWAVRLELEDHLAPPQVLNRLADMARHDPSAVVRLSLASGLQRLPPADRWEIAAALALRGEDAEDANLPLMLWYAVEPLVALDIERSVRLAADAALPQLRQNLARRIATLAVAGGQDIVDVKPLESLSRILGQVDRREVQHDILEGMRLALAGRRRLGIPGGWHDAAKALAAGGDPRVLEAASMLALVFGDPDAFAHFRVLVQDSHAEPALRRRALEALVQQQDAELPALLLELLPNRELRGPILRAMAAYDDARIPEAILRAYQTFDATERDDALATLASRRGYALALLDALDGGVVERRDVSAFTVRQLQSINDPAVDTKLTEVWGASRPTPMDKSALIADYKRLLGVDFLASAHLSRGRLLFARHCAACHRLYDEGHQVGPDLTGSQRSNLDYVLENLVDPNALVGRDYQMTIIQTVDGRVINGIITAEENGTLTIQSQNERILIREEEIDERQASSVSLMPEGQMEKLTAEEIRDLVAYLGSKEQPPLPAEAAGAPLEEQ